MAMVTLFLQPMVYTLSQRPHSNISLFNTHHADKTIKLWKIHEKKVKNVLSTNIPTNGVAPSKAPPVVNALKVILYMWSLKHITSILISFSLRDFHKHHRYHWDDNDY